MGSKRKLKANVMSWKSLFCYDNIEKHLIGQYPVKWKHYSSLSNGAKDTFFEGYVSFRNNLQYKFTGVSRGEHGIVFNSKKGDCRGPHCRNSVRGFWGGGSQ